MSEKRTVRHFVEDLLSDGKDAAYIVMIANNTRWQPQIEEVKEVLRSFSKKFRKRFTI